VHRDRHRDPREAATRAEEQAIRDEVASWRARARLELRVASLTASAFLLGCAFALSHAALIDAYVHGEIDLSGEPRYRPRHPIDRAAIAEIDFERLHAVAIPEWVRLASVAQTPAGRRRAEYAWRDLEAMVAPDRNLHAIWAELHDSLTLAPLAHARRIDWLLWAHDAYVDSIGQPYRLEASMHFRGRRALVTTYTYRALFDSRRSDPRAGEAPEARVRVLARIDRNDVVEGWLGHTVREREGALVIADRVLHFAVRHVWPGLHPALDQRRPLAERALVPFVREEARAAIAPSHFAVLEETAGDQQVLIEVAAAITARHACGSRLEVFDLPYKGLSVSSHRALRAALAASRYSPCPDITLEEAAALFGASERLRTTEGLDDALDALTGYVARSVAAHELRHVVDGPSASVACPGCAERMPPLVRAELSAYLAAFATPGSGYVAALQACSEPQRMTGLPAVAIEIATGAAIPGGCTGRVGGDLPTRARIAERELFGAREEVRPPSSFPVSVAVMSRPERALAGGM
jgi:hypothetical protein